MTGGGAGRLARFGDFFEEGREEIGGGTPSVRHFEFRSFPEGLEATTRANLHNRQDRPPEVRKPGQNAEPRRPALGEYSSEICASD